MGGCAGGKAKAVFPGGSLGASPPSRCQAPGRPPGASLTWTRHSSEL